MLRNSWTSGLASVKKTGVPWVGAICLRKEGCTAQPLGFATRNLSEEDKLLYQPARVYQIYLAHSRNEDGPRGVHSSITSGSELMIDLTPAVAETIFKFETISVKKTPTSAATDFYFIDKAKQLPFSQHCNSSQKMNAEIRIFCSKCINTHMKSKKYHLRNKEKDPKTTKQQH